jgi:hypothetical protein
MKQLSKIVVLAVVAAGIVVLWLIPGINRAENMTYVRIYEDTDYKAQMLPASLNSGDTASKLARKKKYKYEKIRSKEKARKVNAKIFSRVAHFEEIPDSVVLAEEKVMRDSLNQ